MQRQVAPDKREAMGKAIEAEVKKYVDEAYPLVRERAIRIAPSTIGAALEEKFSEDELKQLARLARVAGEQEIPAARPGCATPSCRRCCAESIAAVDPEGRRARRAGSASSSACRRRARAPAPGAPVAPPARLRRRAARRAARASRPRARRGRSAWPRPRPAARHEIAVLREQIDALDRELLALLNRRAGVARAIGELKRAEGSPAFRPEREAAVIDGLKAQQPRAAARGERRADLARDHVGLPRARDADARRLPRPGGHLQRAGGARLLRLVDRQGAVRQRRRGVPRDQRRRRRLRRRAGRELERRRGHALARSVPRRRR